MRACAQLIKQDQDELEALHGGAYQHFTLFRCVILSYYEYSLMSSCRCVMSSFGPTVIGLFMGKCVT
jgi:hypothetical protein